MWNGTEGIVRLSKVIVAGATEWWGMCNCCFQEGAFGFHSGEDKLKGLSYVIWVLHTPGSVLEVSQGYSAAGTCFCPCLFGLRFPFISHLPILY